MSDKGPGTRDIWRTWLMTGARAQPIDRRRVQGRHRGLKQILADGGDVDSLRRPWRDFSRAMARQSVNEAMALLTPRERVLITMAYFAGFSNEEIAEELGMSPRGVQSNLQQAIDHLSGALERGKRVALGLLVALASGRLGRWLSETATPAATHAVAVALLVGAVAAAPVGIGTSNDSGAPPPAAAAPAAQPATAGAPDVALPGAPPVAVPPIAVPAVPTVKLPRLNLPKLPPGLRV